MITFLAFVLVEVGGVLQNLHRCLIYYYGMLVLTENMSKECLFKVVMLAKSCVIAVAFLGNPHTAPSLHSM